MTTTSHNWREELESNSYRADHHENNEEVIRLDRAIEISHEALESQKKEHEDEMRKLKNANSEYAKQQRERYDRLQDISGDKFSQYVFEVCNRPTMGKWSVIDSMHDILEAVEKRLEQEKKQLLEKILEGEEDESAKMIKNFFGKEDLKRFPAVPTSHIKKVLS